MRKANGEGVSGCNCKRVRMTLVNRRIMGMRNLKCRSEGKMYRIGSENCQRMIQWEMVKEMCEWEKTDKQSYEVRNLRVMNVRCAGMTTLINGSLNEVGMRGMLH